MPRSLWSGAISFGLVTVPVKLVPATREHDIRFHQLDSKSRSRIRYKLVASSDQHEVPREQVVKGYEVGPDQYVVVEPKELAALAPEKTRRIDISDFVDLEQIDPVYYQRPYYLIPDETGAKAYRLLVEAMTQSSKVAIARMVMHNKEYLVALRPVQGVLCVETLHFADEVIMPSELEGVPRAIKIADKELAMAQQLIGSLQADFEPEKYHDEYRTALEDMIHKKAEGIEVVAPAEAPKPGRAINLMEALKASLEQAKKAEGKAAPRAPSPAGQKHAAARSSPHPRRRKSA